MTDYINLVIENKLFSYPKSILTDNSKHFTTLFQGEWIGKNENELILQEAKLPGFEHLILTLKNPQHDIDDRHVLNVLVEACKFDFTQMIELMQIRLYPIISLENCLTAWFALKPYCAYDKIMRSLFLKSKAISLDYFMSLRDYSIFYNLSLQNLRLYLGHVDLRSDSEVQVIIGGLGWIYANQITEASEVTKVIWKLLPCLDFNKLTTDYVENEVKSVEPLSNRFGIMSALDCYLHTKYAKVGTEVYTNETLQLAHLYMQSRKRNKSGGFCILFEEISPVPKSPYKLGDSTLFFYDRETMKFRKLVSIEDHLIGERHEYGLIACRESIFLFGGVKDNTNSSDCWEYNSYTAEWKLKEKIPMSMRNIEACVIDFNTFTALGVGPSSCIYQYNPSSDKWTLKTAINIECNQIRCCNFSKECLIFMMRSNKVYLVNETSAHPDCVRIYHKKAFRNSKQFGCFHYKGSLYLKDSKLTQFNRLRYDKFEIGTKINLHRDHPEVWERLELVLCDNIVYTLYQFKKDSVRVGKNKDSKSEQFTPKVSANYVYWLETYNMDTGSMDYIFRNVSDENGFEIEGVKYSVASALNIFGFNRFDLDVEDKRVIDIEDEN